jgi:hypothetical protein
MMGHLLVASALVWWLLVSHITTMQCEHNSCTALPETQESTKELGRYATEANCQRVRAALEMVWGRLDLDRSMISQSERWHSVSHGDV